MTFRSASVPPPVRVEHAIAYNLAAVTRSGDVYPTFLATIGDSLGWDLGAVWETGSTGEALRCVEVWRAVGFDAHGFDDLTRATRFTPGKGLPGRVWEGGDPCWIVDVTLDDNFPRATGAAAAGLRGAYGFPICASGSILGVVEFFSMRALEADDELVATMAAVGNQIGQVVELWRAQDAVTAGAELNRAMLDASLDSVIMMDHGGLVVDFNPAAERTFGYRAEEAIGAPLAELIVPPSLRRRHREGLERYLLGGDPAVLDRRIEITGMRRDGSEFPVELTITRVNLPGPPRFTGYLRDITGRKLAEEELRASRARIVEAADAERRRLERDLHDGAQQRLVLLALALRLGRAKITDDPAAAGALLDGAITELKQATIELRDLGRGIHPAVLTEAGLAAALETLLARQPGATHLAEVPDERFAAAVEAAVYFVVAEALTNASRYADATSVEVEVARRDGYVEFEVRDNGRGGADSALGSGLLGMTDRLAALGGALEIVSPAGNGTAVRGRIPVASARPADALPG